MLHLFLLAGLTLKGSQLKNLILPISISKYSYTSLIEHPETLVKVQIYWDWYKVFYEKTGVDASKLAVVQLLDESNPINFEDRAGNMKIKIIVKILCLLFFIASFSNNVLAKETVYITTGEFPPFTSQKFEHLGTSIRILKAVFELSGMDMKIEFFPFSRAFDLVKRGEKDATFPWFYNDSRAQDFYYTEAVFSESIHFFHLKSYAFDWKTMDDLEGIDIGALISFSFGKEFDEAVKAKKLWVQPAASDEINFRKLLKERIKIFPVNVEVGQHILLNKFTEAEQKQVTYHAKPIVVEPLYLLFSKNNPKNIERVKAFNQGLKQLKSTEKYKQYIEQINQP